MITMDLKFLSNIPKVKKIVRDETERSLFKAGSFLRTATRRSIKTPPKKAQKASGRQKPSSPRGKAPYSHKPRRALRNSILFEVNRSTKSVLVGPSGSATDGFAKYHEFGGRRGSNKFPRRPFMGPALRKALPSLPPKFANIL